MAEDTTQRDSRGRSISVQIAIGERFGKLVIVSRAPALRGYGDRRWNCACDCGRTSVVRTSQLTRGASKSCGCGRRDFNVRTKTFHGHATGGVLTPTYRVWAGMIRRCRDPRMTGYENYGGRGITVCERWGVFENFLADMGERPIGRSIDRINNDGNYEPGNCRWATSTEQARNRRKPRRTRWSATT